MRAWDTVTWRLTWPFLVSVVQGICVARCAGQSSLLNAKNRSFLQGSISYTHAGVLVGWTVAPSMDDAGWRRARSEWQQTSGGAIVDVVQDGVDAAAAYSVQRAEPTTHTTHNKDASCPEPRNYAVPQSIRVVDSAVNEWRCR
jgi:hypothetical protein